MSSPITIVAILTPKPEHITRFEEVLAQVVSQVEAHEPDVLIFQSHKPRNPKQGHEYVLVEKYKNAAALKAHGEQEHFKVFQKTMADEGLMEKPGVLKILQSKVGFSRSGSKL